MNMHSRRALVMSIVIASLSVPAFADVEFLGLDLGAEKNLLFTARVDLPGNAGYDTLFSADVAAGTLAQLSFFPESIAVVDNGRRLQVRNRFGVFMTERDFTGLKAVEGIPSFARGSPVSQGRLVEARAAPDGTMLLYLSPGTDSRGSLILFDISNRKEAVIATDIEYSVDRFPALWSDDSRYFVYAKGEDIFYYSADQFRKGRVPDESWRKVASGRIEQARWSGNGSLYLLRDRSLYRVMPEEFFTQAIYAGIITLGTMIGKAPFPYDPNFDSFWISPDGTKVLLCKDGRNIFLYYLDPDDFGNDSAVNAMPYLFLQGNTTVRSVVWPSGDQVTIFTGSLRNGNRVSGAYRVSAPGSGSAAGLAQKFTELDATGALGLELSPDQKRIAVATADGVTIRDYADWSEISRIAAPGAMHARWVTDNEMAIAGSRTIEVVTLSSGSRTLVGFSQFDKYGWSKSGSVLGMSSGGAWERVPSAGTWKKADAFAPRETATSSADYRVYLDSLSAGAYRNMVMVRSAKGLGTASLLPPPVRSYAPFPAAEEKRAGAVFDHGSRIRRREVSLVFNAYDTAEGLTTVLNALKDYGIRATFFVNGEFIRRNPGAARLIAESGHEVGNMFFTTYDPTDSRFRIDDNFVKRGLARTEDEYYSATGKEISLLWHSPWYSVNSEILDAAAKMNYAYVGRDIDPLDWVGRLPTASSQALYADVHDIITKTVAKAKPGSIISIRIGVPEGGRKDYLFNELPLLLNELINTGYEVVPVSTLMEHAR